MTAPLRPLNNTQRVQLSLVLFGLSLAFAWMFLMRPLIKDRSELRRTLNLSMDTVTEMTGSQAWTLNEITSDLTHATFEKNQFDSTIGFLENRIQFGPQVKARLNEPFQLIDFEISRHYQIEELIDHAKKNKTSIKPNLLLHFPDYEVRIDPPSLLWVHLEAARQIVATASSAGVSSIESLDSLPAEPFSEDGGRRLVRFPIRIIIKGAMTDVREFLSAIPLRSNEFKSIGLIPLTEDKPSLFVREFDLIKSSPIAPSEVQLTATIDAFAIHSSLDREPKAIDAN